MSSCEGNLRVGEMKLEKQWWRVFSWHNGEAWPCRGRHRSACHVDPAAKAVLGFKLLILILIQDISLDQYCIARVVERIIQLPTSMLRRLRYFLYM